MSNTGRKIVLTLKQVGNPGAIPTGNTKSNDMADPDYIAPYQDIVDCPTTSTYPCPSVFLIDTTQDVRYEFNTPEVISNNLNISTIRTRLYNGSILQYDNDFQHVVPCGYYTDTFGSLAAGDYTVDVVYLDNNNSVLGICNNTFAFTIS